MINRSGEAIKDIEQRVLANYLKQTPSKLPLENKKFRKSYIRKRERLFFDLLKMPKKLFRESSILDFGCGTGEADICYAKWGGFCMLIDINPKSTAQTREYFGKFDLAEKLVDIQTKSIFDFSSDKKFDIVISEGMLHHTQDPKTGFEIMARHLKKEGFIVLQLAFDTSHFQRSLQRLILDYLTDGSEKQIVETSKILFKETLKRANRFGGRSINQIIYDFYVNPKHKGINVFEIFGWFKEHNIQYYSSYPMIEIEGIVNGIHKDSFANLLSDNLFIISLVNFLFMVACEDDELFVNQMRENGNASIKLLNELFKVSLLRDYEYNNRAKIDMDSFRTCFLNYTNSIINFKNKKNKILENKISKFKTDFFELITILKTKDIKKIAHKIESFTVLFRGYCGVPSNYIVGYKK